ncbi:hypothetical protein Tco_0970697 [Tanacetum coccineum]
MIGTQFSKECRLQLIRLLKGNIDIFSWKPSDMTGVPKRIIRHTLNVNMFVPPVAQKRRVLGTNKSMPIIKEVEEWVKVGIVRPVRYPTWISNPILVKKVDDTWRMRIDFKNINSACLKDYYPLPEIDLIIEPMMRFRFNCFLDAYKGYHQIQMFEEDKEKTSFYTDQRTYCYTKMSFRLKNVDATYQSKTGQEMIMDIAETFDNLQKINMKLNPKKFSFSVEEGKFLGYTVTSDGIRANPKKIKAIADMQSPKTLKEMQSLSGKLAALNRFLARSAERSLPFFETLKNIMKDNKDDYRWTEDAERAFQEIKKLIMARIWQVDEKEARNLRMKISQYVIEDEVLFKKSYLAPMLRCVGPLQVNYVIREVHEGACGMHSGPRSVVAKIISQGYYWPIMHQDAREEIKNVTHARFMSQYQDSQRHS